jgi:hypothetical protein
MVSQRVSHRRFSHTEGETRAAPGAHDATNAHTASRALTTRPALRMQSIRLLPCARVAREMADSAYHVICLESSLTISRSAVVVTAAHPTARNLIHLPLTSVLFAKMDSRLMMVPSNRGPAVIVELKCSEDADAAATMLRSAGMEVEGVPAQVPAPPANDFADVVSGYDPSSDPGLAMVEAALEWRRVHGEEAFGPL